MALKTSTGIRNYMLDTGPARTALNLGFINIYDGLAPFSADDAIGTLGVNNLLCTVSNNDTVTGLTFEASAVDGSIDKTTAEVWSGNIDIGGTASFYRHVGSSDTGALSTTEKRLQGVVGLSGVEMNLADIVLVLDELQVIDFYSIDLPTS